MLKNRNPNASKRKKPEEIVRILAAKHAISERSVQRIIDGTQDNPAIFAEYMTYTEKHNTLLQSVKQLVPFD